MKTKEPRPLPSLITNEGKVWRDFHIPLGDVHWLEISDQCGSVHIKITDDSTDTKPILSFQLDKKAVAYNALIEILTELKE